MEEPLLVVGLGNPGRDFRETRHNIGFMLLDRLAIMLNAKFSRLQSKALVASAVHNERRIILAKPQTYMNLSGQAVSGIVRFYKLPLENILIALDDLDLPLGVIRIRPGGGSAGQKGMDSIQQMLGTGIYPRLRIGISKPPRHVETSKYVLEPFSDHEMGIVKNVLTTAASAVLLWATHGLDAAMNRYNGIVQSDDG